jgi:hypothetical protein
MSVMAIFRQLTRGYNEHAYGKRCSYLFVGCNVSVKVSLLMMRSAKWSLLAALPLSPVPSLRI